MSRYRGNAAAIKDLVRPAEVHRDVYIDEEVFQLEMEHLFANTWVYVGHDSQVPNSGDYFGTTIGLQPVLMVRHSDDTVKVLYNRCPHKGTRLTGDTCGNVAVVLVERPQSKPVRHLGLFDHVKVAHIIRAVMLRQIAILNYVNPF